LSEDIVQKMPITCAASPNEAALSLRRQLVSISHTSSKKAESDKKKKKKTNKVTVRPSSKKKEPKNKTHTYKSPGSVQPSLLNWRTPFNGMISPVIVVGGGGEKYTSID